MTQLTGIMPFAAATAKLIKHFQNWDDHEVISYDALHGIAGKDVRSGMPSASNLDTAIKNLWKLYDRVFLRVGNGIKLLTDPEIVALEGRRFKSHRKSARKTAQIGEICDLGKLNEVEQQRHVITQAQLRIIDYAGERHTVKRLESRLDGQKSLPDRAQLLDAFK